MLFQKIKKGFELWPTGNEVIILTPADALKLDFTVWLPDAETYMIDNPIFNLFSKVQVEDKLRSGLFIYKKKFLMPNTSRKGWFFGLFGATSALKGGLTPHMIH